MEPLSINLFAGWAGFVLGVVSGAAIGLFFHRDNFAGGYDSWTRRMMRLGHISFFGIGLLNLLFAMSAPHMPFMANAWLTEPVFSVSGWSLALAIIAMPTCCFVSAWWKPFRWLFFVPVLLTLGGVWYPALVFAVEFFERL